MKITINGTEKEIIFKEYTRKIDKWYKNILYKDINVDISENAQWWFKFNPLVLDEANDYLVKELTWLTADEVLSLTNDTYNELLVECKKLQNPPQE